ncbi:acylneuraminate cytidylyltransferase family protein [Algiphilus sp. NNCM1]|nr:acylneuraminate cytidylyltransferase family protein [Algiphilus sp.]MBY8965035.1 acylneuraminate cytidylyltransferase family protein [Algiphilus acroporae]
MNRIAIIPARGGSRRIPRKNVIPFRGRPMIGWTIAAALETELFSQVLVSTDDVEIAGIARAEGAAVPFLRNAKADDFSAISDATLHALGQAEAHWHTRFDTTVQLMANCPLRGSHEIAAAVSAFEKCAPRDFQISAFEFGWMKPWWAMRLQPDGQPDWLFPQALDARSQDLDPLYCPTGAIWIARTEALRSAGTFYGPGYVIEPINWEAAIDIDDSNDLRMAEALAMLSGTPETK